LFEAYEKSDRLKMIGVCYGHQVIAGHFGAQVVGKQRTGGVQSIFINQEAVKKY
jgi:GMP synthase-like glutamine amidotransferase